MHIYDPAYAARPGSNFPVLSGALTDYLALQKRLGLSRTVVVQPTAYDDDNRCTLAAMAQLAEARGVAIVSPGASDAEIAGLDALGMRGVRYHMLPGGGVSWDSMHAMASRVASLGWHVQLQLEGAELAERAPLLSVLPCDLVVDHIGRFRAPVAADDPNWLALRRLVDGGRCWVKLSAPYHGSKSGPPHYADIGALARQLARAAPERMLWASNWPHPSLKADFPDDAGMLDLLSEWAPDAEARRRILVDNPARLYRF
jgi:D-galactarolactone isomerase